MDVSVFRWTVVYRINEVCVNHEPCIHCWSYKIIAGPNKFLFPLASVILISSKMHYLNVQC